MKAAALLVFLLWQAAPADEPPVAQPGAMLYERAIRVAAESGSGQACAALDAEVFPHASPSLADLRIFPAGAAAGTPHEVPFAITLSEAVTEETQAAQLLNLGTEGGKIVFDLEMPARAYTDVTLNLDSAIHDFLATATVIGSNELGPGGSRDKSIELGSFTLFDLSSQHLSRDTTLPLEESTFRYLHVVLSVGPAPGAEPGTAARLAPEIVQGAQVPPSRESQILYSTVAETSSIATVGRESRVTFQVPVRVPVEKIEFVLAPGFKGNFSRDVRVTALADAKAGEDARAPLPETLGGTILRVHTTEAGREIRTEQLGIPAILGANLQSGAKVDVVIENGDDQPLPIAAVRLEMRRREVCFDAAAAAGGGLSLFYGDTRLVSPVYDYARLFESADKPLAAELGPETANPDYRAPVEEKTFTERHPEVLWIVLIAVICALGTVALKSAKNVGR